MGAPTDVAPDDISAPSQSPLLAGARSSTPAVVGASPAPPAGAEPGRRRGVVSAGAKLLTVLVVVSEFFLLHAVYVRDLPAKDGGVAAARLSGALGAARPTDTAMIAADVRTTLVRLSALDVGGDRARALSRAGDAFQSHPDAARLATLRAASTDLVDTLAGTVRTDARQADLIYIAGLMAASAGWMVWFRRLIARHRALQRAVTEQQLIAQSEQRLAALVRNSADLVLLCDLVGHISYAAPSAATVIGYPPEDLPGRDCHELIDPADRERFTTALTTLRPCEDRELRVRMTHQDGRVLHVEGIITNLTADPAVAGVVITVRDVTSRVGLEDQLQHRAFHDPLTELANRQLFSDRLAHALARQSGTGESLVVLFCDLDEFKNINDSLGHTLGDLVLAEVAKRALSATRSGDTVARLGGDEFAILLEGADLDDAMTTAQRLQSVLDEPFHIEGHVLTVRASVGLASAGSHQTSGEEVLRNADVAMYLAKERGKGTIAAYDSELHAQQLERLSLRAALRTAITSDELVVHYQPTIDLSTGSIAGFEALVRWQHPQRGLVGPVEFIPVAEQTGMIHALGDLVLNAACRAAVEFNAVSSHPLSMAVNVTAQQLSRSGFVGTVLDALANSGLPGSLLTLEITESVVLQDMREIVERLADLRRQGIRIAIDDFGTGYSSLAYLRDLPLDILKVDKAFVDHIATSPSDAALTQAIVAMSRSMNLVTVAEGIEYAAQADWLAASLCTYGQGFLYSRAVPQDEARMLILNGLSTPTSFPSVVATQPAI